MERKVGEIFECEGTKLMVIRCNTCTGCYFWRMGHGCVCDERLTIISGTCHPRYSSRVAFVPVEDI